MIFAMTERVIWGRLRFGVMLLLRPLNCRSLLSFDKIDRAAL